MFAACVIVTILTIAANVFSGIAAILHFKPILPGMARAGVPESWLTFPIGTLKTAGAAGLLLGLIGVPLIGTAAAIGLILFFVCAIYTHVRAGDYSPQFGLANGVPPASRGRAGAGPGGQASLRIRTGDTSIPVHPDLTCANIMSQRKLGRTFCSGSWVCGFESHRSPAGPGSVRSEEARWALS
jgi:hypothetical protein